MHFTNVRGGKIMVNFERNSHCHCGLSCCDNNGKQRKDLSLNKHWIMIAESYQIDIGRIQNKLYTHQHYNNIFLYDNYYQADA